MDKTQLLALVQQKLNEGVLTKEDLQALTVGSETKPVVHSKNITNIFYVIGAIIAVIGVIILLAQNWTDIGFVGRVLSTLGLAIVTYVMGFTMTGSQHRVLSQTFFTISGILAPLGVAVFFQEYGLEFGKVAYIGTSSALFILFFTAFWYTRRNILLLWIMLWATWFYYSVLLYVFMFTADITKFATMVLGISFLSVAYYIKTVLVSGDVSEKKEKSAVENMLFGIGTGLLVIPALFFGGIFDFVTLLLIFGTFYLSVFVKSRLTLVFSGILLISYILKVTSKYFVDSIGWPIALIGIGFLVIAIGYGTLYVSRTYIPKSKI